MKSCSVNKNAKREETVVRVLGHLGSDDERRSSVLVVDSDLEGSCGLKKASAPKTVSDSMQAIEARLRPGPSFPSLGA